jgi:nucleoside-diphosphate-sugar epimerase
MKTALVAGSTGLIGGQLLSILLEEKRYGLVIALSRKRLDKEHVRLKSVIVNFDELEKNAEALKADDIYCCLGTTMKKAGSKEAFEKVDYQYPPLLLGARREHRSGEDAAKLFFRIFGFLVPLKYKALEAAKVARAMNHYGSSGGSGVHIHESAAMQQF